MAQAKSPRSRGVTLLIATRKGLWQLHSDAARRRWRIAGPQFLGHIVHHAIADPRDRKTMLAAARTGHLGPTIFRSTDRGRTWHEAKEPPAFREGSGRVVDHTFWLTPGHASMPGVWYAGTSPQGLFRSEDGGATWRGVEGFNEHAHRKAWCGGDQDGTPDGPKLHSVLVDPRDPKHLYIGMSSGGVFESSDGGADWRPLNRGVRADFLPDPDPEYRPRPALRPPAPGAARPPLSAESLRHLSSRSPGRALAGHWRDHAQECRRYRLPDGRCIRAIRTRCGCSRWTAPSVWPRVSPGGKPAVYRSVNGGKTWQRHATGLPSTRHG